MSDYPGNVFDDSVDTYSAHQIEAHFDTGEGWKAICACTWETWDHPTQRAALAAWETHALVSA